MDTEQFAEFLSVQQAQQEQMLQIMRMALAHTATYAAAAATAAPTDDSVTSAGTSQEPSNRMATIKAFSMEKFNSVNYRVSDYMDFFEAKFDDNATLEERCEHLMNIVVESRKRFGKMCMEYEQKTSLVENKMLNLQIETISNYRFKSKVQLPNQDHETMLKEIEQFAQEIQDKQKIMDDLGRAVRNTQNIVLQLKADRIGRKLKEPLTAEAMLSSAKNKNNL